jgi:hypothetical protein
MSYNACMNVWAHSACQDSAIKCEELLFAMLDNHQNKTKKTTENGNSNNNNKNGMEIFAPTSPDTVSFNTVLTAWIRSHPSQSAVATQTALEILNLQEVIAASTATASVDGENHLDVATDTQSFTMAILAQSKSPCMDSLDTATSLLKRWLSSVQQADGSTAAAAARTKRLRPNNAQGSWMRRCRETCNRFMISLLLIKK